MPMFPTIAARFEKVTRNVDIYLKCLDCLNAENLIFKNTLYGPNRTSTGQIQSVLSLVKCDLENVMLRASSATPLGLNSAPLLPEQEGKQYCCNYYYFFTLIL